MLPALIVEMTYFVCMHVCLHDCWLTPHTEYSAVRSVVTGFADQKCASGNSERKHFTHCSLFYFVDPLGIVTVIDAKYGLQVRARKIFKCHI